MDKQTLEKRLKDFALKIIYLTKILPKNEENTILIRQVIRSSCSVGANYAEAVFAQSKQEFIHCLKISRKETNETKYWLGLLIDTNPHHKIKIEALINESNELLKILTSSIKTLLSK